MAHLGDSILFGFDNVIFWIMGVISDEGMDGVSRLFHIFAYAVKNAMALVLCRKKSFDVFHNEDIRL